MPFVVRSLYQPAQFLDALGAADRRQFIAVADDRHEAERVRLIALLTQADIANFPTSVRTIAHLVGKDGLLKLLQLCSRGYCGVQGREGLRLWLYVPAVARPDHRLASALGMAAFERLVAQYARQVLQIANCNSVVTTMRNRAISNALVRGQAVVDVAAAMGLTARQVRNIARDTLIPRSVRPIARVLGARKALYLIGKLPHIQAGVEGKVGRRVMLYVPKVLPPDHRLIRILGAVDAARLVDAFGGETLYPANCNDLERCERNREMIKLARRGVSGAELAAKFGLTTRSVRNILKEIPQEEILTVNDNGFRHRNQQSDDDDQKFGDDCRPT